MEDWVTIQNLKRRNPKIGTRQIAKLVGCSRNTVKAALRKEQYNGYNREERVNPDIEPFEQFIRDSIINKRLRGSHVLADIKSKGYKGSQATLYRYIKKHIKASTPGQRVYQRYETAPGEQMQYDWSDYTVMIGGNLSKVHVHSTILGHSRYRVYSASLKVKQSDIFEALEESFREFDGVCERIQVDNAKVFVDNAGSQNFCGFFGITPSRSAPCPAWSKGKVEKPFDFLEEHFIKGNTFRSFPDFLDSLGYLKLTRHSAELFFKLIAKRYEKGSVIVTSNKAFEQWGEIFVDDVVAAAILDRLLHHSYPFFIQGKSFRMKNIKGD